MKVCSRKLKVGIPEQVSHIGHLIIRSAGEVNPTEYQRKGNHRSQDASPEQQLMHRPAQSGAARDERLSEDMSSRQPQNVNDAANNSLRP